MTVTLWDVAWFRPQIKGRPTYWAFSGLAIRLAQAFYLLGPLKMRPGWLRPKPLTQKTVLNLPHACGQWSINTWIIDQWSTGLAIITHSTSRHLKYKCLLYPLPGDKFPCSNKYSKQRVDSLVIFFLIFFFTVDIQKSLGRCMKRRGYVPQRPQASLEHSEELAERDRKSIKKQSILTVIN